MFDWRPVLFTLITFFIYYNIIQNGNNAAEIAPYSTFKKMVTLDSVNSATLKGHAIAGLRTSTNPKGTGRNFISMLPDISDPNLIPHLEKHNVEITVKSTENPVWLSLILGILPWVLIFGFFAYSNRVLRSRMGGGGMFGFSKSKAKLYEQIDVHIGFDDVAGLESAKTDQMYSTQR